MWLFICLARAPCWSKWEIITSTGVCFQRWAFISCRHYGGAENHIPVHRHMGGGGRVTGLWRGKGLTHTHSPGGSCACVFVKTVTQNTSRKYTSACGMFIQPGGDWLQGKLSVTGGPSGPLTLWLIIPHCFQPTVKMVKDSLIVL